MKRNSIQLLLTIAGCIFLAGCGQTTDVSTLAAIKSVAIVNLDAVAERLGRDKQMSQAIKDKETELNGQLETERATLETQISGKQSEIGEEPSEQQKAELQALQVEANRKLLGAQRQAQNQLAQLRAQLISEFRAEIQPAIKRVAEDQGITLVLSKNDAMVLAFAPQIDITDAVADGVPKDEASKDDVPNIEMPNIDVPDTQE